MWKAIRALWRGINALSTANWLWGLPWAGFALVLGGAWAGFVGLPAPVIALVALGFAVLAYLAYVGFRLHRLHAAVPIHVVEQASLATQLEMPPQSLEVQLREREDKLVEMEAERDRVGAQIAEIDHLTGVVTKAEDWANIRGACALVPGPDYSMGFNAVIRQKRSDIDMLSNAATGRAASFPAEEGPVGEMDSQAEMPSEDRRIAYRQLVRGRRAVTQAAVEAKSRLQNELGSIDRKIGLLRESKWNG